MPYERLQRRLNMRSEALDTRSDIVRSPTNGKLVPSDYDDMTMFRRQRSKVKQPKIFHVNDTSKSS